MKCALHVHTDLSDGGMSLDRALAKYADLGFGCVAITDHEFMLRDNYFELVRGAKRHGMVVMAGVEVDYVPWHYQHLLRIEEGGQSLHVLCHPSAYYLTVDEVIARTKNNPFQVDAVETTYRGKYMPEYDVSAIPCPKVATDDAHDPWDCGRAWIEMEDSKDPARIISAVKSGDFEKAFSKRG